MQRRLAALLLACAAAAGTSAAVAAPAAEAASRLLGRSVQSASAGPVQVQDVVVHRPTGRVLFALAPGGRTVPPTALGGGAGATQERVPEAERTLLSDLVGVPLANRHGDRVGELVDVVLDMNTLQVDHVLARFSSDWLGTEKTAAVPLGALVPARGDARGWQIDVDHARALGLAPYRGRPGDQRSLGAVREDLKQSPWLRDRLADTGS